MLYRFGLLIVLVVLFQLYSFQCIRTLTQNKIVWTLYCLIVFVIISYISYSVINYDRASGFNHSISYSIGLFFALFIFQSLIILGLLIEDIYRVPQAIYTFFTDESKQSETFFPQRRKILSQILFLLASIPFGAILYGMIRGKYNFKVLKYDILYDDLPKSFDGFTITQISDIHCGSFDNPQKVEYGIDLVNKQKSDVILFTGDIVNNTSEELYPWKKLLSKLKAKNGVYSVLGNHDYGDYMDWKSEKDKINNFENLKKLQKEIGFKLLLNENDFIKRGNSRIAIIGVENWGVGRFKKAGNLNKALNGVTAKDFKILMTHDPSHWEAEVIPHKYFFQLTLSGHTHGMQFGIEIPGIIKWSPIKWRYPQFAGLYKKAKQYLNVNRGFGYLAYPGRVGMWPEITVITLKKA